MDGVYIDNRRPKSKAEIKRYMAQGGVPVIESTSMFSTRGNVFLDEIPAQEQISFVGPDPYTKRNFYGTFFYNRSKNEWQVR